jgi:hypothetical protein
MFHCVQEIVFIVLGHFQGRAVYLPKNNMSWDLTPCSLVEVYTQTLVLLMSSFSPTLNLVLLTRLSLASSSIQKMEPVRYSETTVKF